MRLIKSLTLLLGLALFVSAGSEKIKDDGYSYRFLQDMERLEPNTKKCNKRKLQDDEGGTGNGPGISRESRRRSNYSRLGRSDRYYDYNKVEYMATLYYYNTNYNNTERCD